MEEIRAKENLWMERMNKIEEKARGFRKVNRKASGKGWDRGKRREKRAARE